jgi:hypothetical protein
MSIKYMHSSDELKVLRDLKNPFQISYEDSFHEEFLYFIVIEYCEVYQF